jgi:hypothetical protein
MKEYNLRIRTARELYKKYGKRGATFELIMNYGFSKEYSEKLILQANLNYLGTTNK